MQFEKRRRINAAIKYRTLHCASFKPKHFLESLIMSTCSLQTCNSRHQLFQFRTKPHNQDSVVWQYCSCWLWICWEDGFLFYHTLDWMEKKKVVSSISSAFSVPTHFYLQLGWILGRFQAKVVCVVFLRAFVFWHVWVSAAVHENSYLAKPFRRWWKQSAGGERQACIPVCVCMSCMCGK